ncbi:hypothetical protein SO802_011663 [Lithocarpus litseifolius]|uniref:DNA-directed DNA polymerase X domain-containing protein n=1 Tax=Lithocarpus litseifolius TaxID=425828 RepID=A0AAW2D0N8_9ROSI
MVPKTTKNKSTLQDPGGIFAGMVVFLVQHGVQPRRLQRALLYRWLEDSLRLGEKVSEDLYNIKVDREGDNIPDKSLVPKEANKNTTSDEEPSHSKKIRSSPEDSKYINAESKEDANSSALYDAPSTPGSSDDSPNTLSAVDTMQTSLPYSPPDLNRNITEIFGKLVNIYRDPGDSDNWEVIQSWSTLKKMKRCCKGSRDGSSSSEGWGGYFAWGYCTILMSVLKVNIVCEGSFRCGKASCGDLDIIITHPDGKSHRDFLSKYVKHIKDMKFLREDLIFTTHSEEGTDSGVDTYFSLCTYPGHELRHCIDMKVYPRDIYSFGLIAWTGNDVLNRRLRLLAESKGFRLDDTGLFPATHGSGGKRGTRASAILKFNTEKEGRKDAFAR